MIYNLKNKINSDFSTTVLNNIPFEVKRIFHIYQLSPGEVRGGHAHHECKQFIIAATGSFTVKIINKNGSQNYFMNSPDIGLFVDIGKWVDIYDFSGSAVCLVLASEEYDEKDYVRNFNDFKKYLNDGTF